MASNTTITAHEALRNMSRLTRRRSQKHYFEAVAIKSNEEYFQSDKANQVNTLLSDHDVKRICFYVNLASKPGTKELLQVLREDSEVETYLLLEGSFPSKEIETNTKDVSIWMRERKNLVLVELTPVFDLEGDIIEQTSQSNSILELLTKTEIPNFFTFSPDLFVSKNKQSNNRRVELEKMVVALATNVYKQNLTVASLFLAVPSLTESLRDEWKLLEHYVEKQGETVKGVIKVIGGAVTDLRWLEDLFLLFKGNSQLRLPKGHDLAVVLDSVQRINFVVREQRQKSPVISFKNDIFQVETTFDRIQGLLGSIDGLRNKINQLTFYKEENRKDVAFTPSEEDTLLRLLEHHLKSELSNVFHVYIKNTNFASTAKGRRVLGILKGRETKRMNFFIKNNRKGLYNRAKLMVVGTGAAGKTSVCRSLLGQEFEEQHISTLVGDCSLNAVLDNKDVDISNWIDQKSKGQDILTSDFLQMTQAIKEDREGEGNVFVKHGDVIKKFKQKDKQTASAMVRPPTMRNGSLNLRSLRQMEGGSKKLTIKRFKTLGFGNSLEVVDNGFNFDQDLTDGKKLSIWDFGGQKVFEVLHHLYLTNAGLVLLVVNLVLFLTQPELAIEELSMWLKSLCVYTQSVKLLIVGTRAGDSRVEERGAIGHINKMILDILYEHDSIYVEMNKTEGKSLTFFPVENSKETGKGLYLDKLKAAIVHSLEPGSNTDIDENDISLPCNEKIPLAWMFFAKITHDREENITSSMELIAQGVDMGFTNAEMKDLITFFTKAGIFVTFHERFKELNRDEGILTDDVVLRPEWLLTALGSFIYDEMFHSNPMLDDLIGERNIRKFVQLFKQNGIMSRKLFFRIMQKSNIKKREISFLMHLCENMLIMSKLGSVPQKYNLTAKHLENSQGFWLLPSMNSNGKRLGRSDTENASKMIGYIKWGELVPQGLFERCLCSFLAQDTGLVDVMSITSTFASFVFKGIDVHLQSLKPSKYKITIFTAKLSELQEVQNALFQMNEEISALGFAIDLQATFTFDKKVIKAPKKVTFSPKTQNTEIEKPLIKKWDTFLSHTWGPEQITHNQVVEIGQLLKSEGIKIWLDAEEMTSDIALQMVQGMNGSSTFIAFITKEYLEASDLKNSNAGRELHYFAEKIGSDKIIPVLLDKNVANPRNWTCSAGLFLGNSLYLDFTTPEHIKTNLPKLCERIRSLK